MNANKFTCESVVFVSLLSFSFFFLHHHAGVKNSSYFCYVFFLFRFDSSHLFASYAVCVQQCVLYDGTAASNYFDGNLLVLQQSYQVD